MDLRALLQQTFGFSTFRANQEAVCRAATDGEDVLLVMPTGAGKSLCYQLPAIARGGTALVVSPLIALMDDQAAKLERAGLQVARIHSGLSREQSRQACRDYLEGKLQFLFIAPERMRVPGFPEMLAKRKPALIAIDEAHCISAWGHDFRPDYRMLGEHLPALRPAPVIALTATATPQVQQDIVTQLRLQRAQKFIHGFRRDNLAIEVVELSKPRRTEFIRDFLKPAERRPAIVYAPSRKAAEELAGVLGGKAAAYHAGLEPAVRERVQRLFLEGQVEVVVATIAFGMGIDKADVRTVLHAALPASVEAYYQEIGRAGRDGKPSRTVLLYSYADRKMHDFFLDRDYPPVTELQRVAGALSDTFTLPEELAPRLRMDRETVDKAIDKLVAQGAAQTDMMGGVRRSQAATQAACDAWQGGYAAQIGFRRSQIDRMMDFASTQQCRMTALIRHFGDVENTSKPCGHCDFCAPENMAGQSFREPDSTEDRQLRAILRALEGGISRATGRLHAELGTTGDRRGFETLLDGLVRAGLLSITQDTFMKEGEVIAFRKASLTHEGQETGPRDPLGVTLRSEAGASVPSPGTRSRSRRTSAPAANNPDVLATPLTPEQEAFSEVLRAWRKEQAAQTGKPAFLIFPDACLRALAVARPRTLSEVERIPGIGPEKLERYGAALVALCRGTNPASPAGQNPEQKPKSPSPPPAEPRRASTRTRRPATPSAKLAPAATTPRQSWTNTGQGNCLLLTDGPAHDNASQPEKQRAPGRATKASSSPLKPTPPAPKPSLPPRDLAELTAPQAIVETRLKEWRRAESERIGLPQFFVLGTSALREVAVRQPRTLRELQDLPGVGLEKAERFGAAILAACAD